MAEALAVVGGLAAALQLAAMARKFAGALQQFAVDVGAAKAEATYFEVQVRSSSNIITLADLTLSRYCKQHPESPSAIYISKRRLLMDIGYLATVIQSHLLALQDQVLEMLSQSRLWASIKWSFKKASILKLILEMETVKTSLAMLMNTVSLEDALQAHEKDKQKIRMLKREIKDNVRTIRDLNSQLDDQFRLFHRKASYTYIPSDHMAQDALIELGRSMYKRGVVPGSPPPSRPRPNDTFQIRRGLSRPRSPPNTNEGVSAGRSSSHGQPSSARSSRSRTPLQPSQTVRHSRGPPRLFQPPPASNRDRSHAGSSSTRNQTSPKTLRFTDRDNIETISGWVTVGGTTNTQRQITAVLVNTLRGNIISIHKARELNLEILEPSEEEDVIFDFGNGRSEKSVGRAVVVWNKSPYAYSNTLYPPPTATCEVCENSEVGLVFGKPFMKERARLWGSFKR